MIEFRNPYYIIPPGSKKQVLSHPKREFGSVELAIFHEHRYAFFYWLIWTRKIKNKIPPCLVSLDWHQDLCFPCDTEKKWLSELDQSNDGDVAIFSWTKLAGNNDGHILSAAYLNLIGDIYIHCRQATFESDWNNEELTDLYGNKHRIRKFKTFDNLEEHLLNTTQEKVYFDIDLDFFTIDNPYNDKGEEFTYLTDEEFSEILSIDRPLINWIFERLVGITIATEPEHCGGLLKSNLFLAKISQLYFEPDIFTQDCDWKHKSK